MAPFLLVMTERFSKQEKINIAWKGSLTAFITLIIFSMLGSLIFNFFGITIEAFQIMGGILFFRSGLLMLESKIGRSRTTPAEQDESLESDDIAISPIGIPLIAGPGAITASMLLNCGLFNSSEWWVNYESVGYNRYAYHSKINGINPHGDCYSIYN
jgi:multiple antibiotic resistance protein